MAATVAVVGAGIHGLSVARVLAERGHQTVNFDRHPPGHALGSSHGRSRIIRRAYPDPFYTACMAHAFPLWRSLERAAGRSLIHEVGLLYFGAHDSENLISMAAGLREHTVPHEVVGPPGAATHFPDLQLRDGEIGVFTPEAGWVDAESTLVALRELFVQAGGEFRFGEVTPDDLKSFDRVVVCPGPWVADWWPSAPVTVTLQSVAYLDATVSGPVWIEDGTDLLYGFPADDLGTKIAVHRPGPVADPHTGSRIVTDSEIRLITEVATRRFGIANPKVNQAYGCLYTSRPSEDFLIHPLDARTLVVSACSGHGFKFGPWIGELLADLVEGRDDLANHPRFAA